MKTGRTSTRSSKILLRPALLAWFDTQQRDLPWRAKPADPYRVLVSEAMLQQTQVATVIAYFHRFIAALPTVADLAAADEQRVLRLWQGLGYYRRARHLHAAAKAVVANHGGQIPDAVEALVALPGVGRYTAGAVASIAFGRRAPILDGNVARVLARWLAISDPIDSPAVRRRLWRLAAHLVPAAAPGDFNQAMMELGALVCLPRNPACMLCPVAHFCRARQRGLVDRIPGRKARRAPRPVQHHVLAISRQAKLLFELRPDKGLWSGMWQLPTVETLAGSVRAGDVRQWGQEHTGLSIGLPRSIGAFTHQTTHRTIAFTVWQTQATGGRLNGGTGVWRSPSHIDDLPLPNPQRRALSMIDETRKNSQTCPQPRRKYRCK